MAEAAALAKPTLSANKFQQRGGSSSSHLHSTSSSSVRNLSGRVQSASSSPTNESSEPIASICNGMSSSSRLGAASLLPPPNGSSILSASSSALSCTSLSPSRLHYLNFFWKLCRFIPQDGWLPPAYFPCFNFYKNVFQKVESVFL